MAFPKRTNKLHRISFNHVDGELHTSTHAKSAFYHAQNHEEYENRALPVNNNNLMFKDIVNQHLIVSLYLDKDKGRMASSEFKSNLFYFFVYYTLSLTSVLGFKVLYLYSESLSSTHFQINMISVLILIVTAFTFLVLVQKRPFVLKTRTFFTILSIMTTVYLILGDERILCQLTGNSYNDHNQIPFVIVLVTQIPMLKLVLFDSFWHIFLSGLFIILSFLAVHMITPPISKFSSLSEISLVAIFVFIQIIETYRNDYRIKQIFWRREKEVVLNRELSQDLGLKSSGINSDVEVIMEICDSVKKKLKDVSKVIMYKDVKKLMKESIMDIEKIKWKTGHKEDMRVILDPNIDDEDKEYIMQNFLQNRISNNDVLVRNFTEITEKSPLKPNSRFSYFEVEGILSAFSNNWGFDIWFIHESVGQSVSIVGNFLLSKWSLNTLYSIEEHVAQKFFDTLEKAYNPMPYHNACHAADVMHSFLFFVLHSSLQSKITSLEILGSIIAILGHDVAHPGLTNRFLVNNKDDLAFEYNDVSVLENMHCSTIYKLLSKPGCNILHNLSNEDWKSLRNLIITMVLSTDMSKHFEVLGTFRARVVSLKDLELNSPDDKNLVLSFGLKCADLGHSAKNIDLHKRWSFLVCEELFAQGDMEKQRNQSVSMYCDRATTDVDKSQSGFLKNICIPIYEVWGIYLNSPVVQECCIDQLNSNQKYWDDRSKLRKSTMKISLIPETEISGLYRISSENRLK